MEKFKHLLVGQPFVVYKDNNAVVNLRLKMDNSKTFQRWFAKLDEFVFTVRHKKGKENIRLKALSQNPVIADPPPSEDSALVSRA